MANIQINLSRGDRVFKSGEPITGKVVITNQGSHDLSMRLSEKTMGSMFEAMFSNIQPISLVNEFVDIAPPGAFRPGWSEVAFSVRPKYDPNGPGVLYETYHGVNINIQYGISAEVLRQVIRGGTLATGLMEFVVEGVNAQQTPARPFDLTLDRSSPVYTMLELKGAEEATRGRVVRDGGHQNVVSNAKDRLPNFAVEGRIDNTMAAIDAPVGGTVKVVSSEYKIASIDLQLVRKEEVMMAGKTASDISEVQSIQLADGDICHGMEVPIHMILPRLYTCPSITTGSFSINFELNLVVAFQTGANPSDKNALMAAYKFPIKVVRLAPR